VEEELAVLDELAELVSVGLPLVVEEEAAATLCADLFLASMSAFSKLTASLLALVALLLWLALELRLARMPEVEDRRAASDA
jgi:hypothetical protein